SLMPDGLTDTLTRGEVLDLVRFLSSLGKGERWSVGKERLARRWQVFQPTSKLSLDLFARLLSGDAGDHEPGMSWVPAYSTVAGTLPVADLPRFRPSREVPVSSMVRTQLDVATACKVRLKLGNTKGLRVWLDHEVISGKEVVEVNLSRGLHTLKVL